MHQKTSPVIVRPSTKGYYLELLKEKGLWYEEIIKEQIISPDLLKLFTKEIIEQYNIIPVEIEIEGNLKRLILVTDLDQNMKEISLFEEISKMPVNLKICTSENIKEGILYHYNVSSKMNSSYFQDFGSEQSNKTEAESEVEKSLVYKKIENVINTALNKGASDIHFKPGNKGTYVLIKIDGRLINFSKEFQFNELDKSYVVNIIRGMCVPIIDSSKKNMPGDGDFSREKNKKMIDFRVSVMPTIIGEKVVIRLLDPSKVPLDLDELGFSDNEKILIKKIITIPLGLFFVVGPVGSGKSTTIHAALKPFKRLDHNIITIENPCEYKDELLTQIQIKENEDPAANFDGKEIFKASLRQDPETFYFGETRTDKDAAMLVTAALSGHRIVTTLHGIDAIRGLNRLYNLGVEKESLNLINGILAQRLLTPNCPHCREKYTLDDEETLLLTKEEIDYIQSGKPQRGQGCSKCNEGFLGRKVVAEIIVFNNELRDFLLLKTRGIIEIQKFLQEKQSFRSIWEKGLELVKNGEVKLSELLRVFPPNL